MIDWTDEKIAELTGNGFFDVVMDDNGEPLFSMTPQAKDIDAAAYEILIEANMEEISEALQELIVAGLVEVTGVNSQGELLYGLTERGRQVAEGIIGQ